MKNPTQTPLTNALNVDFNDTNKIWLTNSRTLRKVIGILGMGLPLLLFLFLYIDNGMLSPLESISHYYYTRVSSIFVGTLAVLGVFFIIYKGKEPVDFFVSMAAGIFVLCVACFPTSNLTDQAGDPLPYSVTTLTASPFREAFHYASAGIFLACLAYMSLFLFTKSDKLPSHRGSQKKTRNRIYRVCGVLMIIAMLVIGAGAVGLIPHTFYREYCLTYWMETLAVESFGFSWLVKGEALFDDE